MSARVVRGNTDPSLPGEHWHINGEMVLFVRFADAEALVTISDLRSGAWLDAAYELIRATASRLEILRRVEPTIDGRFIVVAADGLAQLVAEVTRHRFGTKDYESLSASDGQRAILGQIATAGGSLRWDLLDDQLEVEHFPLGYRIRDAMADLQQLGAVDVIRTKGLPPLLRLNDTARRMLGFTSES